MSDRADSPVPPEDPESKPEQGGSPQDRSPMGFTGGDVTPAPAGPSGGPGPGGIPGLDELLGMLGALTGAEPASGQMPSVAQLEQLVKQLLGEDAQLPPELLQVFGALSSGGAANPMAAMLRQQFQSLFGPQSPADRLASATDIARKVVAAAGDRSVSDQERRGVQEAVAVARLWIDPVTTLDSPAGRARALSGAEWVEATMPTWFSLVEPVAEGVAAAGSAAMRKQVERFGGAAGLSDDSSAALGGFQLGDLVDQILPAMESLSAGMFSAQIGQAVGALAEDLLTGTEVGLPLLLDGDVALLPSAVAEFAAGLEVDPAQVRLYLAVREAARVRLFAEVPWLAAQLEATVRDYGRHITIDTEAIESALSSVEVTGLQDLERLQEAFSSAELFGGKPTPEQQAALRRLEATLALVEGWVDLVTDQAVAAHLPQSAALGEAVRRRRAGGPAQKVFSGLVGLELRPRQLRDARNLWAALEDAGGVALRDGSWQHPDLAPTAGDLEDPLGYVERRLHPPAPDALDAELDKLLGREGGSPPTE